MSGRRGPEFEQLPDSGAAAGAIDRPGAFPAEEFAQQDS